MTTQTAGEDIRQIVCRNFLGGGDAGDHHRQTGLLRRMGEAERFHVDRRLGPHTLFVVDLGKPFCQNSSDVFFGHVASDGDEHIVWNVEGVSKLAELVDRRRLDALHRADDWVAARLPEVVLEKFVEEVAHRIVETGLALFQDDSLFFVELCFGECRVEDHIDQHVDGFGEVVGQEAHVKHGSPHARVGVRFAELGRKAVDLFPISLLCAFEEHVLQVVCHAVRVTDFVTRTSIHDDACVDDLAWGWGKGNTKTIAVCDDGRFHVTILECGVRWTTEIDN